MGEFIKAKIHSRDVRASEREVHTLGFGFLPFFDRSYLGDGTFVTWDEDFLEAGFCAFSS